MEDIVGEHIEGELVMPASLTGILTPSSMAEKDATVTKKLNAERSKTRFYIVALFPQSQTEGIEERCHGGLISFGPE